MARRGAAEGRRPGQAGRRRRLVKAGRDGAEKKVRKRLRPEERHRLAIQLGKLTQLNHVDTALAELAFGDVGVRPVQSLRDLNLSQTGLLARLGQPLPKAVISFLISTILRIHIACILDRETIPQNRESPIWGRAAKGNGKRAQGARKRCGRTRTGRK